MKKPPDIGGFFCAMEMSLAFLTSAFARFTFKFVIPAKAGIHLQGPSSIEVEVDSRFRERRTG